MVLNAEEKIVSRIILKIAATNQMVNIYYLFKKMIKSIMDSFPLDNMLFIIMFK